MAGFDSAQVESIWLGLYSFRSKGPNPCSLFTLEYKLYGR